jgi:NAD(P)-dependent dehydrogenase (short-subunit alcohol dehydrogenase family)
LERVFLSNGGGVLELKEKTALVSGAASGIGRAVALAHAREGARVIVADISGELNPLGEPSVAGWRKVIEINLSGVFYAMRAQIPRMLAAGGGTIVNMASVLGQVGTSGAGGYVAAKHGVVGLTQAAAIEYARRGIRINAVGPGYIDTPLLDSLPRDAYHALVGLHPIGRLGRVEEVAELVMWLSSERASFVTGAYYPVDGAYLAQ